MKRPVAHICICVCVCVSACVYSESARVLCVVHTLTKTSRRYTMAKIMLAANCKHTLEASNSRTKQQQQTIQKTNKPETCRLARERSLRARLATANTRCSAQRRCERRGRTISNQQWPSTLAEKRDRGPRSAFA